MAHTTRADELADELNGFEVGPRVPGPEALCDSCNRHVTAGDTVYLHGWDPADDRSAVVSRVQCAEKYDIELPDPDPAFVAKVDLGSVGDALIVTDATVLEDEADI